MSAQFTDADDQSESSDASNELLNTSAGLPSRVGHTRELESSPEDVDVDVVFDNNISDQPPGSLHVPHTTETPPSSDSDFKEASTNVPHSAIDGLDGLAPHHFQDSTGLESVQISTHRYPKSRYAFYEPPLPVYKERVAVNDLLEELDRLKSAKPKNASRASSPGQEDFDEIELSDFVMYLPNKAHHPFELWSLQDLAAKDSYSTFLFDGILSVGEVRRYVQAVPFNVCSIGNYGASIHEVGDNIWIKSIFLGSTENYYHLKSPAPEYARFYDGFQWLANLSKHFVDYCQAITNTGAKVSVHDFRTHFSKWALETHKESSEFRSWYDKYMGDDFRRAVASNIHFLFKESIGIDNKLRKQPIWSELLENNFIPAQPSIESKTVVTPYVFDCFEHLRFGHYLKPIKPTDRAQNLCASHAKTLGLPTNWDVRPFAGLSPKAPSPTEATVDRALSVESRDAQQLAVRKQKLKSIKVGDVLSVTKDGEDSMWKDEVSRWKVADDCWYVYVQGVHESSNGNLSFAGIWLYKPSDTCCAKMKYPFPNELFLSDNCTCSHGRILEDEVLGIVTVDWHGHPSTSPQNLFIRQTYLENERFETLKDDHKMCEHLRQRHATTTPVQRYRVGQTVLAPPFLGKSKHTLEPCVIVRYFKEEGKIFAGLRCLLRRNEIAGQTMCSPNELVYSNHTYAVEARTIERTCLVRFYTKADVTRRSIPTPYDRDGTGNAFYITMRLIHHRDDRLELIPIHDDLPRNFIQGFDPTAIPPHKPLRGLDLYCGGGNFGRGLEEGGALYNEWAVDYARNQIHSYYANLKDPAATKLFCGSVDDQLHEALHGNPKKSDLIPMPGEVDFISAGSPCQGFSVLNSVRGNEKGLKNQSLVASVAAYVDFYRPKYGILENVMNMAQKGLGRDEDVLSQLICAIVGMGYQLQLFVIDAWSVGSPQSRSRLFVSFAAPRYQPLEHPKLSHSHPPHITQRGLGMLANGQSFGKRIHGPTPFKFITSAEGTEDLPNIGDGQTYQCTPYPDHVMSVFLSEDIRAQVAAIPRYPRGLSFCSAWAEGRGVMTKEERDLFPRLTKAGKIPQCVGGRSKAWGRVNPHKLFPTVVVCTYPMDSRMGICLHWDQPRMVTVMEARRAQGFPDYEVLVGSTREKWKVIGNSVARTVALALGLSLREAWLKNFPDNVTKGAEMMTSHINMVDACSSGTTHQISCIGKCQQIVIPDSSDESDSSSTESDDGEEVEMLLAKGTLAGTDSSGGTTHQVARVSENRRIVISDSSDQSSTESDESDEEANLSNAPSQQCRLPETRILPPGVTHKRLEEVQQTRILPPASSLKRSRSVSETRILPPQKRYKTLGPRAPTPLSSASSDSRPSGGPSGSAHRHAYGLNSSQRPNMSLTPHGTRKQGYSSDDEVDDPLGDEETSSSGESGSSPHAPTPLQPYQAARRPNADGSGNTGTNQSRPRSVVRLSSDSGGEGETADREGREGEENWYSC